MAKLIKGVNDLATTNPELAAQWNYEKNGDLKPEDVMAGTNQVVWWKLPYNVPMDYPVESLRGKHFDFEWKNRISERSRRSACPFLTNHAAWPGFNDLATINPELAAQWNYEKNIGLTNKVGHDISAPNKVLANSGQKVWWKMPYDVPMDYPIESLRGKHFDFEWEASIASRSAGNKCPFLAGQAVWKGFNDLATVNPELAKEWNYEKNGDLKPEDVTPNANQKVWWKMPYDVPMDYPVESLRGKHFDFEWKATISHRNSHKHNCPYLSSNKVWKGFNDLATTNSKLAAQWNYEKNGDLKPTDVMANTDQKVWWKVSYDAPMDYPVESLRGKHFDFEWEATITQRNRQQGCPYLSGNRVWPGFNDLATVNPELAKEWNYEKNGDLKPTDVTAGSERKVWWKLPYDIPMDYPVKSFRGKHFDFEWEADICHRNNGRQCPYLSASSLELFTYNFLMEHNIEFYREYRADSLGSKRFDIFIPSMNKIIELDGVQHFDPSKSFGFGTSKTFDEIVYADNIKSKHCDNNGIDMLRIPQDLVSNGYGVLDEKRCEKILHAFIFENTIDKQIVGFYENLSFSEYGKVLKEREEKQPITTKTNVVAKPKKSAKLSKNSIPDKIATDFSDSDDFGREFE